MLDLAASYITAGDRGRAEALYTRALAIDPQDADVRVRLQALRTRPAS